MSYLQGGSDLNLLYSRTGDVMKATSRNTTEERYPPCVFMSWLDAQEERPLGKQMATLKEETKERCYLSSFLSLDRTLLLLTTNSSAL